MRRFRLLFAGLSLLLLLPLALLVRRAVDSAALETRTQHQALAERVFDEMERALTELLDEEDQRPADSYPGWVGSEREFVVGHFEIDSGGAVAVAASQGATLAFDDASRITREVAERFATADGAAVARTAEAQMPGTTVALGGRATEGEGETPSERAQAPAAAAYDAFRSLNMALAERDRRRQAPLEKRSLAAMPRAEESHDAGAAESAAAAAPPASAAGPAPAPLSGRVVDARHLVLYRAVAQRDRMHRQGVVLDIDGLAAWLERRALGGNGLGNGARATFSTRFSPEEAAAPPADFSFRHRFAAPFDALAARLDLPALPGLGSAGYVHSLSALLVAVAALGLLALYRMVSVVVSYAERRANFVAAVSHELKTPLTAIRMYGEMLRDGMVSSEGKRDEYYRHITAESERLSRLIENVLEFSRLEKGSRDVQSAVAPLEPVLRHVAELLRPHVESEGFELVVDAAPDLPAVRLDRDALIQVLANLVDNAVKYGRGSAPGHIELGCRRRGRGVVVTVRDGGPGVPARHLARIFEPFYRAESELTRRSKGTGLGLALVRGLVERMGARVTGRNLDRGGFEVEIAFDAAD